MPSWAATRRASSTSATLQQPESDSPPHSLRVTPVTLCPSARRRAAATDESTPPLMATSTRIGLIRAGALAPGGDPPGPPGQPLDPGGDDGYGFVDLGLGGGPADRQAHRRAGQVDREAHGRQDVRRLDRPGGARRPGRGADAVAGEE